MCYTVTVTQTEFCFTGTKTGIFVSLFPVKRSLCDGNRRYRCRACLRLKARFFILRRADTPAENHFFGRNLMKKVLTVLLLFLLWLSCMVVFAACGGSENPTTDDPGVTDPADPDDSDDPTGFTENLSFYLINNGTAYAVNRIGTATSEKIVIPPVHKGLPVTCIYYSAFSGCNSITNVIIPDSVTEIYSGAFSFCSNLISVTIPDSVTSIGTFAFRDCNSLTSV